MPQRIVVLDGAMGTMIQRYKLSEQDYRGKRFRDWKGKDLKGSLELLGAIAVAAGPRFGSVLVPAIAT